MICAEHGDIVMKEFVRYGARAWTELAVNYKGQYILMAEVDRIRYDRDKFSFANGGVHGPIDL